MGFISVYIIVDFQSTSVACVRGRQSAMKVALGGELFDTKRQVQNKSSWEHGSRVGFNDVVQMQEVQRCNIRTSNVLGKSSRAIDFSQDQEA